MGETSPNIVAMIPARMGSTRLKMKNLALIAGRPMISYGIRAAIESGMCSRVIVNSEHPRFGEVARRYGAEFYQRPAELGSSSAKSDAVVFDFMRHHPCEILVWVNPTSPLQPAEEIRAAVAHFVREGLDSLITVQDHQVHCLYDNRPLNFLPQEEFAQTQSLKPVQSFVYSLMMWRTTTFCAAMERQGYGVLCGKVGYFPVGRLSSVIIKTDEDLRLADAIARGHLQASRDGVIQYDPVAQLEVGV